MSVSARKGMWRLALGVSDLLLGAANLLLFIGHGRWFNLAAALFAALVGTGCCGSAVHRLRRLR